MQRDLFGNNASKCVYASVCESRPVFKALHINWSNGCLTLLIVSRITYQLRESQMPAEMSEDVDLSTPLEDGMSLAEKMALWNTAELSDFPPEPAPIDQQLDGAQISPRYQEVRSFLLDGLAY
jgi:hypothetical protein